MIVSKFGGTSVGNYEAMLRSARIVASDDQRQLIVISAISGTTNNLIKLSAGNLSSTAKEEVLLQIEQQHHAIIEQLPSHYKEEATTSFNKEFLKLREHLDKIDRDKRWKDLVYAFGEMMSTSVFLHVLRSEGVEVEWLDARHIIKTDSAFGQALPDLKAIAKNTAKLIQPKINYLTQGFIGSDIFGNTTTLGRGGSDFSAALFAEAVHADTLEIWTDVAGVYTTDPRIVPEAFPIHEISFDEAAELSVFGGKVLHPATLKPAMRAGIGVRVASSHHPKEAGTFIVKVPKNQPAIRAISLRKNQTLLSVHSLEMLHQPGYLAQLFRVLAEKKISVDLVSTSEVSVALTLDTAINAANKVELNSDIIEELRKFAEVEIEENLALIALIGNNLHSTSGISGPLFMQMEEYNIRLICYGASSNNLCFLVNEAQSEDVVRTLHKKFIEKL